MFWSLSTENAHIPYKWWWESTQVGLLGRADSQGFSWLCKGQGQQHSTPFFLPVRTAGLWCLGMKMGLVLGLTSGNLAALPTPGPAVWVFYRCWQMSLESHSPGVPFIKSGRKHCASSPHCSKSPPGGSSCIFTDLKFLFWKFSSLGLERWLRG